MALIKVGAIPQTNYSEYDDLMDYPHLYDSINADFSTQGTPLPDALTCQVTADANQYPVLQMTYPRTGTNVKAIAESKYIMEDINLKFTHQIFKIVHIQKELDNIIVDANHIASTLNDATVADPIQFAPGCADDLMNQVLNTMQPQKGFSFDSEIDDTSNIDIQGGQQAGALLIDPDQEGDTATQSVLGLFGGELEFDNFDIHHSRHAGTDTGIVVTYGKNLQSINQDRNIENMYTGAVFVATYTPGQAIATETNVDWNSWDGDYSNVGVTYMAGGSINIYDSPVEGQNIIGTLSNGQQIHLGTAVSDGSFTPDGKFQINTVNGDDWYPISPSDGGGWVDANWISFDSSGAYAINDVWGDVTVKAGDPNDSEGAGSRVSASGTAVVSYKPGGSIHVYYSPEIGDDHYRTGKTYKNGSKIHYDMIERNSNGDIWYRIGDHEWLYGPHLSTTQEGSYQSYKNSGYGYVKEGAVKYHLNKKGHMVSTSKTVTKGGSSKSPYRWVGKGKNRHKVKNKAYWKSKQKKVKVTAKKGMSTIDKTIKQGGKTYMHTKYGWVSSSSIDYHKDGSVKPKTLDQWFKNQVKEKGKVEIYKTPNSKDALNWSIPNGESFHIDKGHEAKAGDGKTYVEVTYKGKTGWLCEDDINDKLSNLQSADANEDSDGDTDTDDSAVVDQSQKEVRVVVGPLYANGFGMDPNIDKVNTVDISSYFKHDDQDLSGQQADGSFQPTEADIEEATSIGQDYLVEHRYGHIDVSTTVGYQEMSGINADWAQLSLYDYMHVYFPKYDITEKAEVNSIVWDCLSHHYISITIGDLPETWQHLMKQQIEQNTNSRMSRVNSSINRVSDFVGTVNHALKLQGSSQQRAWEKLMVSLGDAHYETGKDGKKHLVLDESIEAFAAHMKEMAENVNNFDEFLKTGPKAPLHFVNANGQEDMKNPVAIVADGGDHSFELNSNGIAYRDSYGGAHALFGVDDSTGEVKGNFFIDEAHIPIIDASHIQCDTIHALGTINGSIAVTSPGGDTLQLGDSFGGTEFGLYINGSTWLTNNDLRVSSGSFDLVQADEADIGGMVIRGVSITRNDGMHVMWSASAHTNLGAYINAHIKSDAIIGGSV